MSIEQQTELGWSQRYLWLCHSTLPPRARREYNISLRWEPPVGSTVDSVTATLDHLVRRHDNLRTTYHEGTGDGPVQRVHPPRPFTAQRFETDDHPGEPPAGVVAEVTAAEFDLARDWPIRALLVSTGSVPKLLLIVVHHTAMDDWSIKRFHHELEAAHSSIIAGQPVDLPPVRVRPADLVAHERSPQGRQANARALKHWDRELASIAGEVFVHRREPDEDEPVAYGASLSSPGVIPAVRKLAGRYRVWPNLVYTAAFAALLSACSGSAGVFFRTYAANRDSAEQSELMTSMSQPVLVNMPLNAGMPFAEVVEAAATRTKQALQYSHCAYDEAMELLAKRGFQRETSLRPGVFYNYLSYAPATIGVRRTRFSWTEPPAEWASQGDDAYFRVYEYRDAAVMAISSQAAVGSRDHVEKFMRGFERFLLEQAESGEELTIAQIATHLDLHPIPPLSRRPAPAATEHQVRTLVDAVRDANKLSSVDSEGSYVTAGGRLLNAPLLRQVLHDRGWTGLELSHVTGIGSLREVAANLRPLTERKEEDRAHHLGTP